jgi:hypothetical protein
VGLATTPFHDVRRSAEAIKVESGVRRRYEPTRSQVLVVYTAGIPHGSNLDSRT